MPRPGSLDIGRLGEMLSRVKGRIVHKPLDRVSPLAVPVMLEIGREPVYGEAADAMLAEAAEELIEEAMGEGAPRGMGHGREGESGGTAATNGGRADLPGGVEVGLLPALRSSPIPPARCTGRSRAAHRRRPASRKGLGFAARGALLPPYDTAATLARLGR